MRWTASVRDGRDFQRGDCARVLLPLPALTPCVSRLVRLSIWRVFGLASVLGLLLAGGVPPATAQSAGSYFHEAAQAYVSGNTATARRAVEEGLEVAPTDARLIALRKKLRQDGRGDGQGQQDPSSNGGDGRSQPSQSGSADAEGQEEAPSSEQGEESEFGREEDAQTTGSGPTDGPSTTGRPADVQARARGIGRAGEGRPVDTLSRAQAERLLRALEGQERQLLRRIQTGASEDGTVEKDW